MDAAVERKGVKQHTNQALFLIRVKESTTRKKEVCDVCSLALVRRASAAAKPAHRSTKGGRRHNFLMFTIFYPLRVKDARCSHLSPSPTRNSLYLQREMVCRRRKRGGGRGVAAPRFDRRRSDQCRHRAAASTTLSPAVAVSARSHLRRSNPKTDAGGSRSTWWQEH